MNHWKIEAAFALGRSGVSSNAWPLIVRAANAMQRDHEAACSIVPEAWQKTLTKRARAAMARLEAWQKTSGQDLKLVEQGDPRGCPLSVCGVIIAGEGFPASWYARAECAAYAERDAQKAGAK